MQSQAFLTVIIFYFHNTMGQTQILFSDEEKDKLNTCYPISESNNFLMIMRTLIGLAHFTFPKNKCISIALQ